MPGSLVGDVVVDPDRSPAPVPVPPSTFARTRPVRLPGPVREFLATESAGGVVLLVAALVALVAANSPLRDGFEAVWRTELAIDVGRWGVHEDLRHWINDLLMALFFFVVGVEVKREVVVGELRSWRRAALPVIAAAGGMVVPALLFLAVNVGAAGGHGWGVPVATDIAFALGVVALLGPRVPGSLKLFLLTLAIADDIGAIIVIAVFYAGGIDAAALGLAFALLVAIALLRVVRVHWVPAYVVLAAGVWLAVQASGVHATIAGVALGLLVPARPPRIEPPRRPWVAGRVEHLVHPWTSFAVIPLFALANAGVELTAGVFSGASGRVAAGVVLGLVVGKLAGITGAAALAVRLGVGSLPAGVSWRQLAGSAGIAGIGFTVSLFISGLAFTDPALEAASKAAVLAASVLASLVGVALLRGADRPT